MKYEVDPVEIVNKFGGDKELIAKYLNYFGVEINIKTIQKWKERKSLPTKRYMELMELADHYYITITPKKVRKVK